MHFILRENGYYRLECSVESICSYVIDVVVRIDGARTREPFQAIFSWLGQANAKKVYIFFVTLAEKHGYWLSMFWSSFGSQIFYVGYLNSSKKLILMQGCLRYLWIRLTNQLFI